MIGKTINRWRHAASQGLFFALHSLLYRRRSASIPRFIPSRIWKERRRGPRLRRGSRFIFLKLISPEQLDRDLRYAHALRFGKIELIVGGLALIVIAGDGTGAVGRAAADLIRIHHLRESVAEADDNHAMVQQRRVEAGGRRLLPAMLRAGGDENGADLVDERTGDPELT